MALRFAIRLFLASRCILALCYRPIADCIQHRSVRSLSIPADRLNRNLEVSVLVFHALHLCCPASWMDSILEVNSKNQLLSIFQSPPVLTQQAGQLHASRRLTLGISVACYNTVGA